MRSWLDNVDIEDFKEDFSLNVYANSEVDYTFKKIISVERPDPQHLLVWITDSKGGLDKICFNEFGVENKTRQETTFIKSYLDLVNSRNLGVKIHGKSYAESFEHFALQELKSTMKLKKSAIAATYYDLALHEQKEIDEEGESESAPLK